MQGNAFGVFRVWGIDGLPPCSEFRNQSCFGVEGLGNHAEIKGLHGVLHLEKPGPC